MNPCFGLTLIRKYFKFMIIRFDIRIVYIMNKHKCFLGLAILATLVTTPAQAEEVSSKASDLMVQSYSLNDSLDQNTNNNQPINTPGSIYNSSDIDSKPSASNYWYVSRSVGSASPGIEKNTAFIAENRTNRTISQDQIKVVQGIGYRVIKLRLSDTGVSVGSVIAWGFGGLIQKRSTDWVRLEINGNQVRVVHTTRTTNAITQFSKWWDHPVRKIAFKPDSCTVDNVQKTGESDTETKLRELKKLYDSKLITEREYLDSRSKILSQINTNTTPTTTTNLDCVVVKENGIIELKDINLLTKGEFKIEYLESGEWKYAAFRVPEKEFGSN
ncbi:SHOCT domain-containing protein [Anabaena sp. FACHB-1237]|uniref:SHOCT domain-containing protein n=1 Tax=Anabaena sp. FACHB-1237 TaxID=2692769 RepID=UPI00168033BA|nr:SHOCT domain-containing protein [Anabaena sp. FACHB-1237]MBD2136804.1 SHOCT domain-containing protein [Anabaena sp. FACHB-1237]